MHTLAQQTAAYAHNSPEIIYIMYTFACAQHSKLYIILCYAPLPLTQSVSFCQQKGKEEHMAFRRGRLRRLRRRLRMRTGARRLYRNRRSYKY